MVWTRPAPLLLFALALIGCGNLGGAGVPSSIRPPVISNDAFITLKEPLAAHAELCAQDGAHPNFPNDADLLTQVFCQDLVPGGVMPEPHGLGDLQQLLGLDFPDPSGENGQGGNPGFAVLAHSSALTARHVTTITPTAFLFTPPPADGSVPTQYAFLAFDPGEQFVEVAVNDPTVDTINFYIVLFEQACNTTPGGCTTTDLLTPKLTTGWSNVRVYEQSTALGDTIFDCHVCHDPQNTGRPFLRMQEIEAPFTHWLSAKTGGGAALLSDFHAARGTGEDYGGIPAAMIDKSDPSLMAQFITSIGNGKQPNAFPSMAVEAEVQASAPMQPANNLPIGASATWQNVYDGGVLGEFIAAPYHDVKITDPDKLRAMSKSYADYLAGNTATLPDVREVILDQALRDLSFAPKAGLDGLGLLKQMCQECHNSDLDPTVSRDRFLVDELSTMSHAERQLAIERIDLGMDSRLIMPPPLFRTVTSEERQAMIQELQQ